MNLVVIGLDLELKIGPYYRKRRHWPLQITVKTVKSNVSFLIFYYHYWTIRCCLFPVLNSIKIANTDGCWLKHVNLLKEMDIMKLTALFPTFLIPELWVTSHNPPAKYFYSYFTLNTCSHTTIWIKKIIRLIEKCSIWNPKTTEIPRLPNQLRFFIYL